MSDDLKAIFKAEADTYIQSINDGLLQLELATATERETRLREMNRMAHSMKGAARAVGITMIETVSHYLEAVFASMATHAHPLTPAMGDTLYDGLDVIQAHLADAPPAQAVITDVLSRLERLVAQVEAPPRDLDQDSSEFPALSDDSGEFAAVSDDLLNIFWVEVGEHLSALNTALLNIEMAKDADKPALLREMNRIAHSMKGAARAVGFTVIETISHHMEALFQAGLSEDFDFTPTIADTLYDGLDLIQNVVNGDPNQETVVNRVLTDLQAHVYGDDPDAPLSGDDPVPSPSDTPTITIPPALMTSTVEMGATSTVMMRPPEDTVRVSVNKLDQLMADSSELLVARMQAEQRQALLRRLRQDHARWQREWRSVRASYIRLARRLQQQEDQLADEMATLFRFLEANQQYLTESNRQLAQLGNLLAQDNMQLATLADQLQDNVSRLRMMPFENVIGGFQRMARDLARDLGKRVHLDIVGAGVDIDKTVLDALKDPLLHLLRNAIDHGLEMPHIREQKGKARGGYVTLSVEQRGSEINIRIADDGQGIDVRAIRQKAVERGIITAPEADVMSDDEAQMLIFHSGFSTSQNVTALSGRGLGMDIVRTRVEGLRGRVHVHSEREQGTSVTVTVPVSLTRLRVILLEIGGEQYAIPSIMVERMQTLASTAIFTAEGQEMITLNDRPLPLVSLAAVLDVPRTNPRDDRVHVLALQTADRAVAFEVDALISEIEIVLKPLGDELAGAPFVAGAALLGTGAVLIVLDANDLVRRATGMGMVVRQRIMARAPEVVTRTRARILVVDDSITTRTLEKNILEAEGFDVVVAIDGVEAWSQLPEITPDLVITDVEMPNMDGFELTRRIKASADFQQMPVILLTSLSQPDQREAGLTAGADAYLVKSRFEQRDLLDTIQRLLAG
jgi:two-component system, chemotaxis family, sensor kinase CheA